MKPESLSIQDDPIKGIITIEGIRYDYEVFRIWGQGGLAIGKLFRIISRDNGTIAVEIIEENKNITE